jgi:hypothetical protein
MAARTAAHSQEEVIMKASAPMFAVRLDLQGYVDFANWITQNDRYKDPPGTLKPAIEAKLQALGAEVYEECDGGHRAFNAATDKVQPHRDQSHNLNISLPVEICRDPNGDIDFDYLVAYVQAIKLASDQDGARALLGMYFLSRCR